MGDYTLKVKKCLKCNNPTDKEDDEEYFCSKCGTPVLNLCSNYSCQEILKEDAKYCKKCGASSVFNNYGLLNDSAPTASNTDDFPF